MAGRRGSVFLDQVVRQNLAREKTGNAAALVRFGVLTKYLGSVSLSLLSNFGHPTRVFDSARVLRVGDGVLAVANFLKAYFGETPLQRTRSDGQAFKPTREACATRT